MSEPVRRWLLFVLCSIAVLLALILYVSLTGPPISQKPQPLLNNRVIEVVEPTNPTAMDWIPADPDTVIVLKNLSTPLNKLGIIDEDWRIQPFFDTRIAKR